MVEQLNIPDEHQPGGSDQQTVGQDRTGDPAGAAVNQQAEAQKQAEVLSAILSASVDHIYMFDRAGCYQYVSQGGAAVLGYEPEALVGKTWRDINLPADLMEPVDRQREIVMDTGQPLKAEVEYITADGGKQNYEYILSPWRNAAQEIIGVITISRDITDRKRAENSLKAAKQEVTTILENITDGFVAFDRDYRYTYVNQEASRMLGRSPAELLGKRWQDVFPNTAAQNTEIAQRMEQAMQEQVTVRFESFSALTNSWIDLALYPSPEGLSVYFRDISNLKQTEAALKQREEELRLITNVVPALVAYVDNEQRYRFNNQRYEDWFGCSTNELYRKHLRDIMGEDSYQMIRPYVEQALSGQDVSFETQLSYPKVGIRHASVKYTPHFNSQGVVEGFVVLVNDITEYKQIETALRNSEKELRTLADAVPQLIWMNTPDGKTAYVNNRWQQYSNSPESYLGVNWLEIIHPDDIEPLKVARNRSIEAGEAYELEYRLRSRSGEYRWQLARVVPVKNEQGQILRWYGTATDIHDRKQAEVMLRESEEKLRLFIQQAPVSVAMFDSHMHYITASQRWVDIYKLGSIEAVLGRSHYELFPNLPEAWLQVHQRCLAGATEKREEDWFWLPDGSKQWLQWETRPWYDNTGKIGGILIFSEDITERKRAAQDREHLLERERTAREAAETANRVKDEFLAVLSHELRTPMNPILGWARLLRSGNLNAERTAMALETIERNAKLQTQLIEDLLDISRIMQGKLTLTVTPVDLSFVISAGVETVRLAAEAKQIQILLDLSAKVAPISGDTARLQQVVWNLLTNAVKFTPHGGQVTVELRQLNQLAQIRVIDTGQGISPDFLPHVFEYFRQADASTTRKFGGLGLGLAIVRQIVEIHGGTVKVESAGEHQGATFTVQLPIMQQVLPPASEPSHTAAQKQAMPLNNLQILVVDDDDDTREFQAFLLEQWGAQVTAAASGMAALQAIERCIPDVVVSDIGMADMDGYMLLQQIRARFPNPNKPIPAIALTAYAGDLDQQKALQAGFQAHITKPVEPEVLVGVITKLLITSGERRS